MFFYLIDGYDLDAPRIVAIKFSGLRYFEKAFIVSYAESFTTSGSEAMAISFSVSAETIKIGNAELVNDWPKGK